MLLLRLLFPILQEYSDRATEAMEAFKVEDQGYKQNGINSVRSSLLSLAPSSFLTILSRVSQARLSRAEPGLVRHPLDVKLTFTSLFRLLFRPESLPLSTTPPRTTTRRKRTMRLRRPKRRFPNLPPSRNLRTTTSLQRTRVSRVVPFPFSLLCPICLFSSISNFTHRPTFPPFFMKPSC